MDRQRILELIALLKNSAATEIEVREGDVRIKIVRALPQAPVAESSQDTETVEAPAGVSEGILVHAHVVGYFRRTDADSGEVLAEPGDKVKRGQAIGRIETLGKSVVVEAPADGEIVEFLAEDGERVEYATPLARLRPVGAGG